MNHCRAINVITYKKPVWAFRTGLCLLALTLNPSLFRRLFAKIFHVEQHVIFPVGLLQFGLMGF